MKGAPGRGTLEEEKPPIFGMIPRIGAVVIRMLEDVKRKTIGPLIRRTIAPGSVVCTDESDISHRLTAWGYTHRTVCHAAGEVARDDAGDGFCRGARQHDGRVLVVAAGLAASPPRVSQEKMPLDPGSFVFVHHVWRRGKALLGALVGLLLKPSPRNTG